MVSGVGGAARWTDAERTRLRELREQGRTIGQAAQDIGRSYRATCRACHEHGIHRRQISKLYTKAEMTTARAMRAEGSSFDEIAAKLPGRTAASVRSWCHNNHVVREVDAVRVAKHSTAVTKSPVCIACRRPFVPKHAGNMRCDRCLNQARSLGSSLAV